MAQVPYITDVESLTLPYFSVFGRIKVELNISTRAGLTVLVLFMFYPPGVSVRNFQPQVKPPIVD